MRTNRLPEPQWTGETPELEGFEGCLWVTLAGAPPFPLSKGCPVITIGREGCDLTLPHGQVSRLHAALLLDPSGEPVIEDRGSRNGTFVNGRRLTGSQRIQPGDVLGVGSYELRALASPPAPGPGAPKGTRFWSGDLAECPLRVLLPALEESQRSGVLRLSGPQRGEVVLLGGVLAAARCGQTEGREAILELLSWERGRFFMTAELRPVEEPLPEDSEELIKAWREQHGEGSEPSE